MIQDNHIHHLLVVEPFQPFEIRLSNGDKYGLDDPTDARINVNLLLYFPHKTVIINLAQIVSITVKGEWPPPADESSP